MVEAATGSGTGTVTFDRPAGPAAPSEAPAAESFTEEDGDTDKHQKYRDSWVKGLDLVLPIDSGYGMHKGPIDVLKRLLADGEVDANDRDQAFGLTPLMKAAARGYTEAIEVLLDNAADIDAKDNCGVTALMKAEKWPEAKALLLKRGATDFPKPKQRIFRYRPEGVSEWVEIDYDEDPMPHY